MSLTKLNILLSFRHLVAKLHQLSHLYWPYVYYLQINKRMLSLIPQIFYTYFFYIFYYQKRGLDNIFNKLIRKNNYVYHNIKNK